MGSQHRERRVTRVRALGHGAIGHPLAGLGGVELTSEGAPWGEVGRSSVVQQCRRRWLHQVNAGGPGAASAAGDEVLAESADRGVRHPAGQIVRRTAQRLPRSLLRRPVLRRRR